MVCNQFAKTTSAFRIYWGMLGLVGSLRVFWVYLGQLGSTWVYQGLPGLSGSKEGKNQSQTLFVVETFIAASNSRVERLNNQGAVTPLP